VAAKPPGGVVSAGSGATFPRRAAAL